MSDALIYALCALSNFRCRNRLRPKFAKSKNAPKMVLRRREYAYAARDHIREARKAGFRGSIREQVAACPQFQEAK